MYSAYKLNKHGDNIQPWHTPLSIFEPVRCSVSSSSCGFLTCIQVSQEASKVKVKVKSLSRVRLFVTPWTIAHQAPPSKGFSRQEYWSGLPFHSPRDLPDPGIKPRSPTLQADALTSEPPGKPRRQVRWSSIPISLRIFHSLLWSTQSKALAWPMKEKFFWNSLALSMIQRMLAKWILVPLPFLNPAYTSGSSRFTYCWNLSWRILGITLLVNLVAWVRLTLKCKALS